MAAVGCVGARDEIRTTTNGCKTPEPGNPRVLSSFFSMLSHAVSHLEQSTCRTTASHLSHRRRLSSARLAGLQSSKRLSTFLLRRDHELFPADHVALITSSAMRQGSDCVLEKPERVQHSSLVRSGATGPAPTLQAAPPKVRARLDTVRTDSDSIAKPHWRESSLRRNFLLQGVGHMGVRTLISASAVTRSSFYRIMPQHGSVDLNHPRVQTSSESRH
ncbi:uncharacterized protein BDZ83DRAFT_49137 [Colletotrichum acutatum]|uniref:Uncharacterized protein n=1 Tax=Glomerella acutata TaxID=27357 RepID=A0AAD9CZT5_GLOAC|nr:uncharacterized protein BDZ83DRAFT_49137 [Colletotrichum acutatum]KAK1729264.1 hypothetical protein BDZ83DRAFT_49137 [Colletotrichum acutatum]